LILRFESSSLRNWLISLVLVSSNLSLYAVRELSFFSGELWRLPCSVIRIANSTFSCSIVHWLPVKHSTARSSTTLAEWHKFTYLVLTCRKTPVIQSIDTSLHWLPVEYRVKYKLTVTTYKVLTSQEPSCLKFWIDLVSCPLMPTSIQQLKSPERALRQAAPAVWNSLPQFIFSNISCFTSFKLSLKSEYFNCVNSMSFFSPNLWFFTIVNDFNVRHQPCYDYNYM